MVTFVQDSLDNSDLVPLTSHTGAIGATWTTHGAYGTGNFRFRTNGIYPYDGPSIVYASGIPNVAEYDITVDYHYINNTIAVGVGGRISISAATLYYVYHNANEWVLIKSVNGTLTTLGVYAQTLTANTTYTLLFQIRNATKKVFINGVERISSTDNEITAAGRVGFRSPQASADNAGKQIRSILAADLSINGVNTTDSDNLVENSTSTVLGISAGFDPANIAVVESRTAHRIGTATDADNILATESRLLVSLLSRTDADNVAVAETRAIIALLAKSDSGNISVVEGRSIVTNYPPVLNDDYYTLIKERTDVLHRAAHRRFPNCQVIFKHSGIFNTTMTQTSAIVVNSEGAVVYGFITYNYWSTQTVSLVLLSNIYLYPEVIREFGYSTTII